MGDAVHAHVVAKFGLELNVHLPKLAGPHGEEAIPYASQNAPDEATVIGT